MSVIHEFESHLFISYAHLDNESLFESDQGWVDLLHTRLETRLGQLLGEKPKIWRDPKLSGNDVFGNTLLIRLSGAALMVSILSPRYIKSEWCLREIGEFYQHAMRSGGATLGDKSRIFKVIKTPINRDEHPEEARCSLGYEFYEIDPTTDRFREFGYDGSSTRDHRYWDKLEDLAQDIKSLIERMTAESGHSPASGTQPSGKTVYLAETTSDLSEGRDRIRRELQLNGHHVLPDRSLSLDQNYREDVKRCLAESHLSVHLVGAKYGIVPEGEKSSVVEIQHELASERNGSGGFLQINWMPSGIRSKDERQQRFINLLLSSGADLLQENLEDLKNFIHQKLNPPKPPSESKTTTNGKSSHDPTLVYLVCDQLDYDSVAPIEDCLYDRGYEVLSLAGEGDPQAHIDNLLLCDAMLTYCGNTTDAWLQKKKSDLIKLPGYGRTKPMLAKAFYISAPRTTIKERFRIQQGLVIKNYGEFSPASLSPFIEQIERAKGV